MNEWMHKNRYYYYYQQTKYSYSKTDILVSRERDRKEEEVERGIDLERKERRGVCVFYKNSFWCLHFSLKFGYFGGGEGK